MDGGKTRCSFDRKEIFQNELREAVVNDKWCKNLHTIYTTVVRRYPDVELTYPFERALEIMKNWQDELFLQTPMTLMEYTRILLSESWESVLTEWGNIKMSVHTVQSFDESWVTVYADHAYLQLFSSLTDYNIHIYSLDDISVPKIEKIMCISILVGDEWWPIIWALIGQSSAEAYLAVFEVLNSVHHIMKNPKRIVLPYFESALGDAINMFFPSTSIICTMSIEEKLDSLKGQQFTASMLKKHPRTVRYFKKLSQLNQLPANEIKLRYEQLLKSSKYVDSLFLQKTFDCYRKWWLEEITPERFSQYGHENAVKAEIASHLKSIDLPDVVSWKSILKPFKIWKLTERLLEIFIILREKSNFQIDTEPINSSIENE